jgi:hypothetical protein
VLAPSRKFNVSVQNIDIFMRAKEVAVLFSHNRLPVTPSIIATAQSDGCAALQQETFRFRMPIRRAAMSESWCISCAKHANAVDSNPIG